MTSTNGGPHKALELGDKLFVQVSGGEQLDYEVVGVLDEEDGEAAYAVLMHEGHAHDASGAGTQEVEDSFIVTDLEGKLIESDDLAQEILDDFMAFAEEAAGEPVEAGLDDASDPVPKSLKSNGEPQRSAP